MSDEEATPVIVARLEAECRAENVTPYPGSIVGYCDYCKAPIRLSPKSQKMIKNRGALAYCPTCMETEILAKMEGDDVVMFHGRDPKGVERLMESARRVGMGTLPIGSCSADVCIPCACGNHDKCEGQTCGCGPCQTDGPVHGL